VRIARGQSILIRGRDAPSAAVSVHATHAGRSIAVGEIAEGAFHPRRVFVS
jgi:tRNA pseudouridine55 synthase